MKKCLVEGCEAKHHSLGYCRKHSWRFQQNGDPCVSRYKRHGKDKKAYNAWHQMVDRCTNPENKSYARYGGRGIRVCDAWLDFEKFYADMGPSNGLTIDRRDNDGNYDPSNCRWATRAIQQRNNSRTRLTEEIVADIRSMHASGQLQKTIAEKYGISDAYVSQIVNFKIWR
jgi:hypothetical protein